MTGDVQTARPFPDHLNELILRGDRLLKPYLLVRLLDSLNYSLLLLLEFERYQAHFPLIQPLYKDRTGMQEAYVYLRLIDVLLIDQRVFQILQLSQDHLLRLEFILAPDRVRVVPSHLCLDRLFLQLIQIYRFVVRIARQKRFFPAVLTLSAFAALVGFSSLDQTTLFFQLSQKIVINALLLAHFG